MKRYPVSGAQRRDCMKLCLLATVGLVSLALGLLTGSSVFSLQEGAHSSSKPPAVQLWTKDGVASCKAATACEAPLVACGVVSACGKEIYCGGCQFPEWCGGGGAGRCGCQPRTCASLGRTCGEAPDGCGGSVTCGSPCQQREINPFADEDVWSPEVKQPYRVGYYEAGKADVDDDVALPGDIRAELFSHLVFAYGKVDQRQLTLAGLERDSSDPNPAKERKLLTQFLDECKHGGAIPIVALGESREGDSMAADGDTWRFVTADQSRKAFISNLVKWLEEWDFRGVEFHSPLRQKGRDKFALLVLETRTALTKLGAARGVRYWVSASIPLDYQSSDFTPGKDALVSNVDWIMVQTDNMLSALTTFRTTSAHAPIFSPPPHPSLASVVEQWLRKGVPRGKILLGLSAAGRLWKLKSKSIYNYGAPSIVGERPTPLPYRDVLRLFGGTFGRLGVFHPPTSTIYGHTGNQWVSYDDPRTISLKVVFVVQAGLLGYGLWSVNMDCNSSLSAAASAATLVPLPVVKAPLTGVVMMVTSASPEPCESPRGDHLLNKALKNKVDYAELHGMRIFASSAVLEGPLKSDSGRTFKPPSTAWGKVTLLLELMSHHSEVEWFFWAGPEVLFLELSQPILFSKYRGRNLALPFRELPDDSTGKAKALISTGAFLIRNCAWSYQLLQAWLELALPNHSSELQGYRSDLGVKRTDELPDDTVALLYLLAHKLKTPPGTEGPLVSYEPHGKFGSDWQVVLPTLPILNRGSPLRASKKVPLFTEFGGCQICNADDESPSRKDECFEGMEKAFVSGDNQLLLRYRLEHLNLTTPKLRQIAMGGILHSL